MRTVDSPDEKCVSLIRFKCEGTSLEQLIATGGDGTTDVACTICSSKPTQEEVRREYNESHSPTRGERTRREKEAWHKQNTEYWERNEDLLNELVVNFSHLKCTNTTAAAPKRGRKPRNRRAHAGRKPRASSLDGCEPEGCGPEGCEPEGGSGDFSQEELGLFDCHTCFESCVGALLNCTRCTWQWCQSCRDDWVSKNLKNPQTCLVCPVCKETSNSP